MTSFALPSRPILGLSLRAVLARRRALALALLNVLPIIAVLVNLVSGEERPFAVERSVGHLLLPVVIALVALALTSAAIGDEREDGTLLYLTQTPIPRMAIVAAKVTAAWIATMIVCGPGILATMVLAADRRGAASALWVLLAALTVTLAYCAMFAWLSLRMRRAVITGLAYIVLWEGSVASFAKSADKLSVSAYGRVIARRASPDVAWNGVPAVSVTTATIVLGVIIAMATVLASRRLDRMELP
jgi:ABC-2 type transport system permease protein